MLETYHQLLASEGVITLTVRARPNARVTKVVEILDDGSIKTDVHATPEDGAANQEIVRHLAELFDVPRAHVELMSGHRGRLKIVRITR